MTVGELKTALEGVDEHLEVVIEVDSEMATTERAAVKIWSMRAKRTFEIEATIE